MPTVKGLLPLPSCLLDGDCWVILCIQIGNQLALQLVNRVLQFEFTPLEALYAHIVMVTTGHQMIDRNIQIPMLRS